MFYLSKRGMAALGLMAAAAVVGNVEQASAATTGAEFDTIYTTISGWAEGTLGRLIALVAAIVGVAMAVTRQQVMPFIAGIGIAIGMVALPGIINGISTATLTVDVQAAVAALPASL